MIIVLVLYRIGLRCLQWYLRGQLEVTARLENTRREDERADVSIRPKMNGKTSKEALWLFPPGCCT